MLYQVIFSRVIYFLKSRIKLANSNHKCLHRLFNIVGLLLFVWLFHQALITSPDSTDNRRDDGNETGRHLIKTSVTSTPKYLPAFCVRCTAKPLKEELSRQEQCAIVDNNKESWAFYEKNHSSESFIPEWHFTWAKYWQSFPIVKIDPTTNRAEFVENVTDFDPHILYARYLVAPSLLSKNLQYDSTYWRLNLTSSIFARMNSYEFPFKYWTLHDTWISGQQQSFEKRHPWYNVTLYYKHCEELHPMSLVYYPSEIHKQWRKLVDAVYETANGISERVNQNDITYPYDFDKVVPFLRTLLSKYHIHFHDKRGLVIGSHTPVPLPWLEYELWRQGVAHVTTVDYVELDQSIYKNHPRMHYLNPKNLGDKKTSGTYDFAMAYSSIEHIGLGRYSDPLNPDGDLMELGKLSCLVKPGGFLFLAVPPVATDCMVFNLHRLYGPIRYSMLTECWKIVEFQSFNTSNVDCDSPLAKCGLNSSFTHPWFVLQNLRGCSIPN